MNSDIIVSLITTVGLIIVGVLQAKSITLQKQSAARADRRAEESLLAMEFMDASCSLGLITAKALTNQKLNGDVEDAMTQAGKAQAAYKRFIARIGTQSAAKI